MFEKSLYDLIRGLRNHKGNERQYIHHSLQECRKEIRGSDMDIKATALLKLIYLEMFGHDMSWASFHVLEVMSCPKYQQKRVGYLAAVQSFRPDTEVLMLATNLLKKDISSPLPPTISLSLITLPQIITSSLALSLLSDLLPRLGHSNPNIRKKTSAALYRLALVYPDTLRSAWPKMKDLLMDEDEDSSVTAVVVNVVCELGWRRPRDFLSLAPRLFDLLVDGGNNWMAIKIIKLFATLTPLEPRLIKKLLSPLMNLIKTTPAMSLLYECINGVIQGGILNGAGGTQEAEEIASLCVGKLRGMIVVEGDPNLKYVSILAFNRILTSHPHLVSMHQDVIMDCIDDPDVSIRLQALGLCAGMVTSDNLVAIVEHLMQQLKSEPVYSRTPDDGRSHSLGVEPAADSDGEDPEETLKPTAEHHAATPMLTVEYRISTIRQIIEMCSKDTYSNILDFEWYLSVLVQLVKLAPSSTTAATESLADGFPNTQGEEVFLGVDITSAIGRELRNVAVRVVTVRADVVLAAYSLLLDYANDAQGMFAGAGGQGILRFCAWIVGEYFTACRPPDASLDPFIHSKVQMLSSSVLIAYLQAIPKVAASVFACELDWSKERQVMISLSVARVIHFLEPLATHPSIEVQERSVEFLELIKVVSQAIVNHGPKNEAGPLLLTTAIPQLFNGFDLNPVAPTAQRKVPLPVDLDLESPINKNLTNLLAQAETDSFADAQSVEFGSLYYERTSYKAPPELASDAVSRHEPRASSYQNAEVFHSDTDSSSLQRRAQKREQNRDDPFYIGNDDASSGTLTPLHKVLRSVNGEDLDVDSIPIMDLNLEGQVATVEDPHIERRKPKRKRTARVHVAPDENIEEELTSAGQPSTVQSSLAENAITQSRTYGKAKKSLLQVDSSGLTSFPLNESEDTNHLLEVKRRQMQDEEMAKALAEVEHARLEMQRASERIEATDGTPAEGTFVKKKKKKKAMLLTEDLPDTYEVRASKDPQDVTVVKKKKRKKKPEIVTDADQRN